MMIEHDVLIRLGWWLLGFVMAIPVGGMLQIWADERRGRNRAMKKERRGNASED